MGEAREMTDPKQRAIDEQQVIEEIGDYLEWSMQGPFSEWLEEAGLDDYHDWASHVIEAIRNLQAKDIKL